MARAGDGRLMPVVSSGTFLRARKDTSDFARPSDVHLDVWNNLTRDEKLALVREKKSEAAPSSAYRTFTVEVEKWEASNWPHFCGPPPRAIVRRIVRQIRDNEIVSDEITTNWTRDDWHRPPARKAGKSRVVYVYDPDVAGPRGEHMFPELDAEPFNEDALAAVKRGLQLGNYNGIMDMMGKSDVDDAVDCAPGKIDNNDDSTDEGEPSTEDNDSDVEWQSDDAPPWETYDNFADSLVPSVDQKGMAMVACVSEDEGDTEQVPAMPCARKAKVHRKRVKKDNIFPWDAAVARPVSRKEISQQPKAQEAQQKEWNRLRQRGVWDESKILEWDKVAAKAKAEKRKVHIAYLFGICVEKGSELPDNDPNRKYKYRVVFQGNRVVDEDWQQAQFDDLGSSPANLESSRACDLYGCIAGHDVMMADAEQAYVQATLKGTETWVCLPDLSRSEASGKRSPSWSSVL